MTTDRVKWKLAVILIADVQGYSRLMDADEEGIIRIPGFLVAGYLFRDYPLGLISMVVSILPLGYYSI
jgi:hypothetical protein